MYLCCCQKNKERILMSFTIRFDLEDFYIAK